MLSNHMQTLKETTVLVTRPIHQQGNFLKLLDRVAAKALSYPLINIKATANKKTCIDQLNTLVDIDYLIFVSPNAVLFAHQLLPFPWLSSRTKLVAIGDATARTLLECGQSAALFPQSCASSEGLLGLDEFKDVQNCTIAIISGNSSRTLLTDILTNRGALVKTITVYESHMPSYSLTEQLAVFKTSKPDIICITSNLGLKNLLAVSDSRFHEQLLNTPLVVNSERCVKLARQLGFKADTVVAKSPGALGQLAGLQQWYFNQRINQSE
jgi:uroporphyrinogen-III synthase